MSDTKTEIELSEEVREGVLDFLMETGFRSVRWDGIELKALGVAVIWEGDNPVPHDTDEEYYTADEFTEDSSTYEAFQTLADLLRVELATDQVIFIEMGEEPLH